MKLFSGLLSNICKILRRFEKLKFIIMLSHKHNHHLFHHCYCLNFEMWFKSESRGRSHGEHKSNSEGGDFQNIKIMFQKIEMIVRKLWWWWLQRREFTVTNWQRSLRKREVALSRINIYIVYIIVTCHTIRWQFDVNNGDDGRNWFDDDDDDVYIDDWW